MSLKYELAMSTKFRQYSGSGSIASRRLLEKNQETIDSRLRWRTHTTS
jgi:hypothetical protein